MGKLKNKRKFKMPTAFTIIFLIIFLVVIFSWILNWAGVEFTQDIANAWDPNTGEVTGSETTTEKIHAAGILDIFLSIIKGFVDKAEIIVFILSLGGFIMVLMNSKAIDAFTQGLARKLKDRAILIIPILMAFFSFCGSTYGMAEEAIGFYMITIPLMFIAGYDKMTGFMIVFLGAGTGVLASTVNPFVISAAVAAIGGGSTVSSSDGMVFRWIGWIIMTIVSTLCVMFYSNNVKKNPTKSATFSTLEGDKTFFLGEKVEEVYFDWRKITTLIIFMGTFIIMVLYLVQWDVLTDGKTDATGAGQWMNDNIPWLTSMIPGFGVGAFVEIGAFFLIAALIVTLLNWKGEEAFVSEFIDGAKDLFGVCLIIATASGVGIILMETGMSFWMVDGMGSGLGGMAKTPFVIVSYILFIPLSFLIPSTSGFAAAIFPIWGQLNPEATAGAISAFSYANGLINLIAPTSGIMMASIGVARIDYGTFVKGIWKPLAIIGASSIVVLIAGSFLPSSVF